MIWGVLFPFFPRFPSTYNNEVHVRRLQEFYTAEGRSTFTITVLSTCVTLYSENTIPCRIRDWVAFKPDLMTSDGGHPAQPVSRDISNSTSVHAIQTTLRLDRCRLRWLTLAFARQWRISFTARSHARLCRNRYLYRNSIHPSVRVSVTLGYCFNTAKYIVKIVSQFVNPANLVHSNPLTPTVALCQIGLGRHL